jgi:hypothetical protein
VLGLSTPPGRRWWVFSPCAIAIVVSLTGPLSLAPRPHQILTGTGEQAAPRTLIAKSIALMSPPMATGISVLTPWGGTPRARRVQRVAQRHPLSIPHRRQRLGGHDLASARPFTGARGGDCGVGELRARHARGFGTGHAAGSELLQTGTGANAVGVSESDRARGVDLPDEPP